MKSIMVGLIGGIASGKTTVAEYFKKCGAGIVDADEVAREVVVPGSPAIKAIADHFGKEIINKNGTLNRQKLKALIFGYPVERLWLEGLLHPYIRKEMNRQIALLEAPVKIMVIPLLKSRDDYPLLERIVLVDIPEAAQLRRLEKRDELSVKEAKVIVEAQPKRQQRLSMADYVIHNEGTRQALAKQVRAVYVQLLAEVGEA